jgi:hypothetical protein
LQRHRRRRRRNLGLGLAAALALVGGFTLIHLLRGATAAQRGKAALTRAEASLSARQIEATRQELDIAKEAFVETRARIRALGPVGSVVRLLPVLGNQLKAVDTLATAGLDLSTAGQPLVDAVDAVLHPADDRIPVSAAMDALRSTRATLGPALAAVSKASDDVSRLNGMFLLGPLAQARDDLAERLPRIETRAVSAENGLSALIAFAGENEPKRYLFLSQNPDEVRPTGGFIGTYGLLSAHKGQLKLERYDAMDEWTAVNPDAVVPPDQVGPPFRYHSPPLRRTMNNVNSGPDWPQAAQLAASLWKKAGEEPVDGVISFTPGFMGRVLTVVGPVTVAAYGETVTAENLDARLNFYTHQLPPPPGTNRKDFVAALAENVMHKLLDAPASQWEPLARVVGEAFEAKQAMAWSSDPIVARSLTERHWDGSFRTRTGDFFFNSEFEYSAKNGRGIRRVYDHHVSIAQDGSARITTKATITNTEPPDVIGNSAGTLAYHTIYGPKGALLDEAASDPLPMKEPALADHPAVGWFRAAAPSGGQTTLTVVWNARDIAVPQKDGLWRYELRWPHLPDHFGDVVNLTFDLPVGWTWTSASPPPQFSLDQEFSGSWLLSGV